MCIASAKENGCKTAHTKTRHQTWATSTCSLVFFESQATLDRLVGAWWSLALFVVFAVVNTFLGEELLFHGVLLPRMQGVFGKWSWVANGVLFGFYHVHQPWSIAESVIGGVLFLAYPSWRFRSTWMGVVIHSAQSVFFAFLVLGVELGLA